MGCLYDQLKNDLGDKASSQFIYITTFCPSRDGNMDLEGSMGNRVNTMNTEDDTDA